MTAKAATSRTGFFQPAPRPQSQWDEDAHLHRAARLLLPEDVYDAASPSISSLSSKSITPEIYSYVVDAENNPPYLESFTAFGAPADATSLRTSLGWQALQNFGLREGIVATGYDAELGGSARVVQAIKIHLWSPSSAMVVCPSGMQDGAISVLKRDLERTSLPDYPEELKPIRKKVFESALGHLLSRDPATAWTSGQWMTERRGGSDVRGSETFAEWTGVPEGTDVDGLPLGPWRIDGFKWFSSATDCGAAIVLAFTSKGLSCFFAPTRRVVNGVVEMNGIRIQRLKNKLGTKALPTAELEVKGMQAWLLGEEGKGVSVIATVLNVTRFHNAVRAVGFLGRGLGVARAFARVRTFPSRAAPNDLRSIPLFCKSIAAVTLRYRADTLFATFLAALVGAVETGTSPVDVIPSDPKEAALLLRILTSVAKAYITKHGIHGLQECMETLGGVGYLENNESPELNVARLFRDANVFSIWEGTTDVLATDTVKVLRGSSGPAVTDALEDWLRHCLGEWSFGESGLGAGGFREERLNIVKVWREIKAFPQDKDELFAHARKVVDKIGDVVCATLLVVDAERDEDPVAIECAQRFCRFGQEGRPQPWREVTQWDSRIVFDGEQEEDKSPRAKL